MRRRYVSGLHLRRAYTAMEVVLVVGITFPFVVFLFWIGIRAFNRLWQVIDLLVGWPYL